MQRKQRVLFMGEGVTLSHVARPFVLASALAERGWDVHFAVPTAKTAPLGVWPTAVKRHDLESLPGEEFLRRLEAGRPIYDDSTLAAEIKADLTLIDRVAPDVVVSDMRLSLVVSARVASIPLVTITNAYWNPKARIRHIVPDIPLARRMGVHIGQYLFDTFIDRFSRQYALPFDRQAQRFELGRSFRDVRDVYTDGDLVLYADMTELVDLSAPPAHHRFMGPLLWSPNHSNVDPGSADDLPLIIVTLGSSGHAEALERVLMALASLPVRVVAATAGRTTLRELPANAHVVPFVPLDRLLPKAALFICNGGSGSIYHALKYGVPLLGLASNFDQFLAMACVEGKGLGKLLRARECTGREIRAGAEILLTDPIYRQRADHFKSRFAGYEPVHSLETALEDLGEMAGKEPNPTNSSRAGQGAGRLPKPLVS